MIDKKRNQTEKVALLKTYIIQFIYPKGNGWAFVNATSVSQAQSVFYNQTKYEDTKITGIKETKWYGDNMQLVYEGAVTTSTILNVSVTLKDLIDSTGAFESAEEYIRFILEQLSYTKEEIDEKFKNLNVDIDLSNYYTKEEIDEIIRELPTSEGTQGKDGITPHIGDNGNWYIGDKDTGKPSRGETGPKGEDGKNGINGTNGVNGSTPYIGSNGNWFIDGIDTRKPSQGDSPYIGGNGNWWIGNKDLGVPATSDATALNNSAIRRITDTDLTTYGISKDYIERATSGENAGHYSYEQYNQMRLNAEQMTKLIKDTYDAGYSGILFPRGHYCFCSMYYPSNNGEDECIWILNIANFTVDFNGSTLELLTDSTADWDLSSLELDGTNFGTNVAINSSVTYNDKSFRRLAVAVNNNNEITEAFCVIKESIKLKRDASGDLFVKEIEDSDAMYRPVTSYSDFVSKVKIILNRHCRGTVIGIKQSNNVIIKNAKLKGDAYSRTFSDDVNERIAQLKVQESNGIGCNGMFVYNIFFENLDISGFSSDGISTSSRILYRYITAPTYNRRKTDRDSYVKVVTRNTVTALKRFDKYYIIDTVDDQYNTRFKDPKGPKYRVILDDISNDRKQRAISEKIETIYSLSNSAVNNTSEVFAESYKRKVYTILTVGGLTRNVNCYPKMELVTYKKLTREEVTELGNIGNVTDITDNDILAWFNPDEELENVTYGSFESGTTVSLGNVTIPQYITYYRIATDGTFTMLLECQVTRKLTTTTNPDTHEPEVNVINQSIEYYQPIRILDTEYREDVVFHEKETHFRAQCYYVPVDVNNMYKPVGGIFDLHFQVCNNIYIRYCNIHDNLRGNFAFGSNDVYIDHCILNKRTSKSVWVPVEAGSYPRYAGGTDYMIDVEDAVCNNLTISHCVLNGYPENGSILGSKLLRLYFHHNRSYLCGLGCKGVYEEVISDNIFYSCNVYSKGSGKYEPEAYTRPIYRNSLYTNNTYYNSYIPKFVIDKYHTVNIENCVIQLNETHPEPGDMNFNNSQNDVKEYILKAGSDTSDLHFDNCKFIGTDATLADCYLGVVNNSKFIKGKNYYVRELNNVEIDDAYIAFIPTDKNVNQITDSNNTTLVINITANAVKGLSLENTIYNKFYLSDLVKAATNNDNTAKCIINFNFINCDVELKNTKMQYGIVPGYYSANDVYHKCITRINYIFNGCTFGHKSLGNEVLSTEYPLINCFKISDNGQPDDWTKVTFKFIGCDLYGAVRTFTGNTTVKCLAKTFFSVNNDDTYNKTSNVKFIGCNIPDSLYLDSAGTRQILNE